MTPLLKAYLELGLVVTDYEFLIEYNAKPVFKWFQDKVCDDRRRAEKEPIFVVRGETSKTKGIVYMGELLWINFVVQTPALSNEKIKKTSC